MESPSVNSNVDISSLLTGHFTPDQLPQILQQFVQTISTLQQKVQHHDGLFERLNMLETENQELKQQNQQLSAKVAQLQHQLDSSSSTVSATPLASDPTAVDTHNSSPATTASLTFAQRAALHLPPSLKKRISAARAFRTAAKQGPKGFDFVYIGRSRKISRSEVRSRLRRAGIDTSRIIDICFPASGVIGILLHVQYKEEFKTTMAKAHAEFIEDFDPTDPAHLADPKYWTADQTDATRTEAAIDLNYSRCVSTLKFIRPVLVSSVARFFEEKLWFSDSDVQEAVSEAARRLALENPKQAAFVFRGVNGALATDAEKSEDSAMDVQ